jgi:hypothetical protein
MLITSIPKTSTQTDIQNINQKSCIKYLGVSIDQQILRFHMLKIKYLKIQEYCIS